VRFDDGARYSGRQAVNPLVPAYVETMGYLVASWLVGWLVGLMLRAMEQWWRY